MNYSVAKKILLYGGSFDPVHNGHLHIAREAADRIDADKVVFIPAGMPPHKLGKQMASAEDRYEMLKRATEFESMFDVSDYEVSMDSPSFTVHTVRFFRSQFRNCQLCWLIGGDSFSQLASWYSIGNLVDICTIVTVGRPGFELDREPLKAKLSAEQIYRLVENIIEVPLTGESSTEVRDRAGRGESIEELVPGAVAEYIREKGLYGM